MMQTFENIQSNDELGKKPTTEVFPKSPVSLFTSVLKNQKYAFDIDFYANSDVGRRDAKKFIEEGFLKTYGAQISVSTPWILAINNGKFKAALGIRSAINPLFIEQYIDQSIETILEQKYIHASRSEIAEIGNLYSNAQKFTLPLFLTAAVSLFCNNYKYMVFAGTQHVLDVINRTGIEHTFIASADQAKLQKSENNWGSYYDTNPSVVAISLSSVVEMIGKSKRFSSMFESLTPKISNVTKKLQGKQL